MWALGLLPLWRTMVRTPLLACFVFHSEGFLFSLLALTYAVHVVCSVLARVPLVSGGGVQALAKLADSADRRVRMYTAASNGLPKV